jgi:hypothetical protein
LFYRTRKNGEAKTAQVKEGVFNDGSKECLETEAKRITAEGKCRERPPSEDCLNAIN